jgi:hypothetical protein
MNIQRIGETGSILLCLAMAAGCSTSDSLSPTPPSQAGASSATGTGDIVMTVNSDAALKEDYTTIKDLAGSKNLVAIVRGTVAATRACTSPISPTVLTVNVTKPFAGRSAADRCSRTAESSQQRSFRPVASSAPPAPQSQVRDGRLPLQRVPAIRSETKNCPFSARTPTRVRLSTLGTSR